MGAIGDAVRAVLAAHLHLLLLMLHEGILVSSHLLLPLHSAENSRRLNELGVVVGGALLLPLLVFLQRDVSIGHEGRSDTRQEPGRRVEKGRGHTI